MYINLNNPYERKPQDGLRIISDKPNQCQGCPLQRRGRGFIPGVFHGQPLWKINTSSYACPNEDIKTPDGAIASLSTANLAICGEAPAVDERLQNAPFSGAAGNLLRAWVLNN